jgi:hypothetical protein
MVPGVVGNAVRLNGKGGHFTCTEAFNPKNGQTVITKSTDCRGVANREYSVVHQETEGLLGRHSSLITAVWEWTHRDRGMKNTCLRPVRTPRISLPSD